MSPGDGSNALSPDPEAPFRSDPEAPGPAPKKSNWRRFFRIIGYCIKFFEAYLLFAIGIPPGLVRFRPKRLPGRFIMSPYRILFIFAILRGVAAAALGLRGQSSSFAWVGIAGSGIMAMILFLLKEHRDTFPDFAPWLFETDYKAGCVTIALFIVQIGIAQLASCIWYNTIKSSWQSEFEWTDYFTASLILSEGSGFAALLWLFLPALDFVEIHNPFSILFVEEIMVLLPRWLWILMVTRVKSLALWSASGFGVGFFSLVAFLIGCRLDHRFKDILSRAAGPFGVENTRGSLYEPIVFIDAES